MFGLTAIAFGFHLYNSFPALPPAAKEGLRYGVTLSNVVSFFYFFMLGLNDWNNRIKVNDAADVPKTDADTSSRLDPFVLAAIFALLYIVVPILTAILLTLQP